MRNDDFHRTFAPEIENNNNNPLKNYDYEQGI
jgi:hypothetical protein